jgi:DNA segregation ATPase FtsK/SpoIIIE-like protein
VNTVEQTEAWRSKRRNETLAHHHAAAVETVSAAGFGSTRLLQTRLDIGYYRATLLIEAMQAAGLLGEFDDRLLQYELLEARGFY